MLTLITNLKVGPMTAKATTQRTNFNFDSFLEQNGNVYGFNGDGLYKLGGDDDDGTDIDAYFATGSTNLGDEKPKRLRYFFTTLNADGAMYLKVTPNMDSSLVYTKTITPLTAEFHKHRIKLGEGLKAVNWEFEFGNTDGYDFTVTMMEVLPTKIGHRANRY